MLDKRTPDRLTQTPDYELPTLGRVLLTLFGLVGPGCLFLGSFVAAVLVQLIVPEPSLGLAVLILCPLAAGCFAMLKSTYLGSLMFFSAYPSGVFVSLRFSFGGAPFADRLWDGLWVSAPLLVGVLLGLVLRRTRQRKARVMPRP